MVKIKYILFCMFLMTLAASCGKERRADTQRDRFKLKFYTNSPAFTRQQTTQEAHINQIDALVFVSDGTEFKYQYNVQGTSITDGGNFTTSFMLSLFSEPNPVKIYVYANARDAITSCGASIGDTENTIKSKVTASYISPALGGAIPMWAEHTASSGLTSSANNQTVSMEALRAIARVDVYATDVASQFTMNSIRVYRASSLIQLAPNSYTTLPMEVSTPSIPSTSTSTIITTPITTDQNQSVAQLYVPEAIAPNAAETVSKACCVVVGGYYNNSTNETFYRIDFGTSNVGQVLRNHHYTFNVTSVGGEGWKDPDEAANNIASKLSVTMEDWADIITNIGTEGMHFFRIKSKSESTQRTANSNAYFPVSTNILDYTLQWCDGGGNPEGIPAFTLDNEYFHVSKGRNSIIVTTLQDNPVGAGPIYAYILVGAGRSQTIITVTQPDQ